MSAPAIALNRFGLGARPDEAPPERPRHWLLDQLARYEPRPTAWGGLPASPQIARDYVEDRREMRQADGEAKQMARKQLRQDNRQLYRAAVNARMASALIAPAPFAERLVHFWANHFAVSADKMICLPFIGAFEAEAIRPNILGKFEDLLLAAERHPAMLLYLDQVRSTGPESRLAERVAMRRPARKPGLNENLAREIMELHTLGVRSGYAQADVTEFARAMTGWSVGGLGRQAANDRAEPGRFAFRPAIHEPGTRTIMGKSYAQAGEAQARAVLHDLGSAPATADHIATKLARHFVADEPPAGLVKRLSTAFQESGGDLPTVYRALVDAPESWAGTSAKFKTPWDWLVSSLRGIGMEAPGEMQIAPLMQQLGQPVWRPGSPAGFDDIAQSWAAPDALVRRVEVAQRIALRVGDRIDPRSAAAKLLPGAASAETVEAIGRAESQPTGLALLLVSPEFQRR
ncbi:DUF1800 domain-containing protein [Sphingomonas sanxanigenens]|uniref:DUF1800 domain-containing protein n=1 Tax=Sphingomonas sanxanigenens DSM 19645 = NX02 TaxID=1123269 RepID=W0AAK2_9SPHN|nr:DUF1800 domain-containing protein [Sphingomonas sanxanigenens]AHE53487.1 hypothetical protein NX02_08820 [Sphingomonas sanxanigenens DSM 19645 = NX02]